MKLIQTMHTRDENQRHASSSSSPSPENHILQTKAAKMYVLKSQAYNKKRKRKSYTMKIVKATKGTNLAATNFWNRNIKTPRKRKRNDKHTTARRKKEAKCRNDRKFIGRPRNYFIPRKFSFVNYFCFVSKTKIYQRENQTSWNAL